MLAVRIAGLLGLALVPAFAANWSGVLVDSKCFEAEERNVNPSDTLIYVDRDRNRELRVCAPHEKTKLFSVVLPDGTSFRLDSAGNMRAAELVKGQKLRTAPAVSVTGEKTRRTVQVTAITLAK